ncbi:MAG: LON peptidase substrate-binding domain-containing protein, partial [Bdellovibrionota bacterium]
DTGGERRVVVRGLERVQLSESVRTEPYLLARIEPLTHEPWRAPRAGRDLKSDLQALRERAELLAFRKDDAGSRQVLNTLQWIDDPGALADYVAHHFVTDWYVRQEVLEITDPAERLRTVLDALGYESEARP